MDLRDLTHPAPGALDLVRACPLPLAVGHRADRPWRTNLAWDAVVHPWIHEVDWPESGTRLVDREDPNHCFVLRLSSLPLTNAPDAPRVFVAEDVTDAMFDDRDPTRAPVHPPIALAPFATPGALRCDPLLDRLLEHLWSPAILLDDAGTRIVHANGPTRAGFDVRLGESLARPFGVARDGGSEILERTTPPHEIAVRTHLHVPGHHWFLFLDLPPSATPVLLPPAPTPARGGLLSDA